MITRAKAFRFKNNLNATIINARNVEEKFENIVIIINVNILRSRAMSMKKKTLILNKQTEVYEKQINQIKSTQNAPKETLFAKVKMMYIENTLSLNKKKFNKFILDYEKHFIITIEKLRNEITILTTFIHKAKKRLRNNI